MIKSLFTLLIITTLAFQTIGQEKGYFGRKTMIEIGGGGAFPLFQNIFGQDKGYIQKGGEFQKSLNLLDANFRASFGVVLTENAAIALEYQQKYYAFNPIKGTTIGRQFVNDLGQTITEEINAKAVHMSLTERIIMPRFIFSTKQGRVPAGITHEIGVGYSMIAFNNRKPDLSVDTAGIYSVQDVQDFFLDERVEELKGLKWMYGVRMNYPISKQLLFHFGVRYSYNTLFKKKAYRDYDQTQYWLSGKEAWEKINQRRQFGIMELNLGLTFCL
jgi:hypothetical protein